MIIRSVIVQCFLLHAGVCYGQNHPFEFRLSSVKASLMLCNDFGPEITSTDIFSHALNIESLNHTDVENYSIDNSKGSFRITNQFSLSLALRPYNKKAGNYRDGRELSLGLYYRNGIYHPAFFFTETFYTNDSSRITQLAFRELKKEF